VREVCFLIGDGDAVLWSDASDSPIAMPDARDRWLAIWERRDRLVEIAHSHPNGPAAFSSTDESTMAALTAALGRELRFSVVAPEVTVARVDGETAEVDPEPWWADLLRLASGMTTVARSSQNGR
jgi:hypothetical protein